MTTKSYTWKDPGAITTVSMIFLAVQAGSAAMCIVVFLSGGDLNGAEEDLSPLQLAAVLLSAVFLIGYVGGIIAAIAWALRVNKNAHTFARPATHSPASMIYWYVVPFMFLFKPFGALEDVWFASGEKNTGFLRVWWAAFLISAISGRVSMMNTSMYLDAFDMFMNTLSAVLFMPIIWKLMKAQRSAHEMELFSDPQPSVLVI